MKLLSKSPGPVDSTGYLPGARMWLWETQCELCGKTVEDGGYILEREIEGFVGRQKCECETKRCRKMTTL